MKLTELEKIAKKIRFEMEVVEMEYNNGVQISNKQFYRVLSKLLDDVEKANIKQIKTAPLF